MRINQFIAHAGICSRRAAEILVLSNQIKVNNQVLTSLAYEVKPSDVITYKAKRLQLEKKVYILLNKPRGYVTTLKDPYKRKTVIGLLQGATTERVYPVGRLDRYTTGLLLFTNDGKLAMQLAHPAREVQKSYEVTLKSSITAADMKKIQKGLLLKDGRAQVDSLVLMNPRGTQLSMTLHIGKNRIVRRIFASLGYQVISLDRVSYAGLTQEDLRQGKWRMLTTIEVQKLKNLVLKKH